MKSLKLLCPVNDLAPASVPLALLIPEGTELVTLFLNFILLSAIASLCLSPIQIELLLTNTSLNLLSTLPKSISLSTFGIIWWFVIISSFVNSNIVPLLSNLNILDVIKFDVTFVATQFVPSYFKKSSLFALGNNALVASEADVVPVPPKLIGTIPAVISWSIIVR